MNRGGAALLRSLILAGMAMAPAAPAATLTPAMYDGLPLPKAMAVSADSPAVFGIAAGRANDLAASTAALNSCETRRSEDVARCEVVRLNDERITTGAEVLAQLPEAPHPLYLWKYESPRATVFLAGSIHLLKPSLYPLPEQYAEAWALADHLVLEVNTNAYTPAEMRSKTMAVARLSEGQSLEQILPPELYRRLQVSLARYGLDGIATAPLKPAALMNQLVVARLLALGYLPEWGVEEQYLLDLGPRDVLELETLESQLALLFDQPLPVQIQLLADTLDQEMTIEPLLERMLVAWLSGDDQALEGLFEQQAGTSEVAHRFNEDLLDRRNTMMAAGIRRLLETGRGTYFALVGAAHHLGDRGIPAELANAGWQGLRITSDTPLNTIRSNREDRQ